jgi:hypothetical protein
MRKPLFLLTAVLMAAVGCKVNPSPPSVEDAMVTWHNIFRQSGLDNKVIQLVDLKKTDGQFAEVNGVKVYTLFYEAREKHLTKMGKFNPGDIETIHSNYGFQKTENGWQGPDGTHFKD